MAMVDPWSWWPTGSSSPGLGRVDFLVLQSLGTPIVAFVITGDVVLVARR